MSDSMDAAVSRVRQAIASGGPESLMVDDLRVDDLACLGWSGSPTHVAHVADELERVARGEAEYLVIRAPDGVPIAKGGIDYTRRSDAGTIWQLATHPDLRGFGIGARLISEAEARIAARPRPWAVLGVEHNNPRAQALYERLGYEPFAEEPDSWEQETKNGEIITYTTNLTLMRKRL